MEFGLEFAILVKPQDDEESPRCVSPYTGLELSAVWISSPRGRETFFLSMQMDVEGSTVVDADVDVDVDMAAKRLSCEP